jgi:hypothetical protein
MPFPIKQQTSIDHLGHLVLNPSDIIVWRTRSGDYELLTTLPNLTQRFRGGQLFILDGMEYQVKYTIKDVASAQIDWKFHVEIYLSCKVQDGVGIVAAGEHDFDSYFEPRMQTKVRNIAYQYDILDDSRITMALETELRDLITPLYTVTYLEVRVSLPSEQLKEITRKLKVTEAELVAERKKTEGMLTNQQKLELKRAQHLMDMIRSGLTEFSDEARVAYERSDQWERDRMDTVGAGLKIMEEMGLLIPQQADKLRTAYAVTQFKNQDSIQRHPKFSIYLNRYPPELEVSYRQLTAKKLQRGLTEEEEQELAQVHEAINAVDRQSQEWAIWEAAAEETDKELAALRREIEALPLKGASS